MVWRERSSSSTYVRAMASILCRHNSVEGGLGSNAIFLLYYENCKDRKATTGIFPTHDEASETGRGVITAYERHITTYLSFNRNPQNNPFFHKPRKTLSPSPVESSFNPIPQCKDIVIQACTYIHLSHVLPS